MKMKKIKKNKKRIGVDGSVLYTMEQQSNG